MAQGRVTHQYLANLEVTWIHPYMGPGSQGAGDRWLDGQFKGGGTIPRCEERLRTPSLVPKARPEVEPQAEQDRQMPPSSHLLVA